MLTKKMDTEQTSPSVIPTSFKVVTGISVFVAFLALALGIVALILYATVPQPVTPTLKHVSLDAVSSTTATSTVTFTPANYTYFIVNKATTSNNRVIVGVPDKKNYFYAIYNTSTSASLNVYNKGGTESISTIPQGKAGIFLVNKDGTSVAINNTLYYQP